MRRLLFAVLAVAVPTIAIASPRYCVFDKTAGVATSDYVSEMKRGGFAARPSKECSKASSRECSFDVDGYASGVAVASPKCMIGFVATVNEGRSLPENRALAHKMLMATMKIMGVPRDDLHFADEIKSDETSLPTSSEYRYDKRISCCDVATKETSGGGVILHFFKKKGYFN